MDSTCTASTLMNWFVVWEARGEEGRGGGMLLGCPAGGLGGGGGVGGSGVGYGKIIIIARQPVGFAKTTVSCG